MKKAKKRRAIQEVAKPEPLFSDQSISQARDHVKRLRENGLDKPDRSFSKSAQLSLSHFFLAMAAVCRLREAEKMAVLKEAFAYQERLGVALFEKRSSVPKCLTSDHGECMGDYVSLYVKEPIVCNCACHTR